MLIVGTVVLSPWSVHPSQAQDSTPGTRGSDTDGGWREFRGNLNNTGYSTGRVPVTNKTILRFDTGWAFHSSPVISGDILYFGSDSGQVYAVSVTSGEELWNFTASSEIWATPLVVGDRLFVGSMDSNMYALNRHNGSLLWRFTTNDSVVSSAKYYNGILVFSSYDGYVYFLNATTGLKTVPPYQTSGQIWGSPAIVDGTAIVASNDGNVSRIWVDSGTKVWNFTLPAEYSGFVKYSSPSVASGRVFIGSNDRSVYSLDLGSGHLVWKFTTGNFVYATPGVHGSKVFVHSTDGYLYALPFDDPNHDGNISTSEVLWRFRTYDGSGGEGGSSPAIADGKVIVASRTGRIYCIDEQTGAEVWSYGVSVANRPSFSSPAVIDGMVFAGLADGAMYGFAQLLPGLTVDIETSVTSLVLESERSMQLIFNVTRGGQPIEGAFITFTASSGILSQSGASTLEDGKQKVKYLAPKVTANKTVTISAKATKYGMEDASASIHVTIIPANDYGTQSGEAFSLGKYMGWIVAIGVLVAANILVYTILMRRKRRRAAE